jgi:ribosomal RNA-processing protein 9
MPDSFFQSKSRKRKRTEGTAASKGRRAPQRVDKAPKKARRADEELSDETQSDGGLEDLDLERRPEDEESVLTDEDDENETPAQKRLRLAQLYLDGLKENLGRSCTVFEHNFLNQYA